MKKILLSCRDACAAHSMIEIAKILRHNSWPFTIASQEPATSILISAKLETHSFESIDLQAPDSSQSIKFLEKVKGFLNKGHFDAAMVGLSTPGTGGIDEAIVKIANFPTFLIQDYWGDLNLFFNSYPTYVLSNDQHGVQVTKKRFEIDAFNLGSVRHIPYVKLTTANKKPDGPTYCWLDQPLEPLQSYFRLFEQWTAFLEVETSATLQIRLHPSSSVDRKKQFIETLKSKSIQWKFSDLEPIEETIFKSDIVCSVLSNGNMDAAYINHFADQPVCLPVHLLIDHDLNEQIGDLAKQSDQPIEALGVGVVCRNWESWHDLQKQWKVSLNDVFEAAKNLPSPSLIEQKLISMLEDKL